MAGIQTGTCRTARTETSNDRSQGGKQYRGIRSVSNCGKKIVSLCSKLYEASHFSSLLHF